MVAFTSLPEFLAELEKSMHAGGSVWISFKKYVPAVKTEKPEGPKFFENQQVDGNALVCFVKSSKSGNSSFLVRI